MSSLISNISRCTLCADVLAHEPNPVLSISKNSKIVIIGQAPGKRVHETGIPWNDKSGERLREWMGVTKEDFYNEDLFSIVPMGFCYPGKGKSGDLPPRPECATKWHSLVMNEIKKPQLVLLIGSYAQNYYLKNLAKKTLTETVKNYEEYLPKYLPLPHPSPRNNIWLKKNEWFEASVIPVLQNRISELL